MVESLVYILVMTVLFYNILIRHPYGKRIDMTGRKKETTTASRIKEIIAESLCCDDAQVKDATNIQSDLGADSLDIVELCMNFEEEFGIELDGDDMHESLVVKDLVELVQSAIAMVSR